MIIRHGNQVIFRNVQDDEGNSCNLTVAQYIYWDLSSDSLFFSNPLFNTILEEAVERCEHPGFEAEPYFIHHDNIEISRLANSMSMDRYQMLKAQTQKEEEMDEVMRMQKEKDKEDSLQQQTIRLLLDFRLDYLEHALKEKQAAIAQASNDPERLMQLMAEFKELQETRNAAAKALGSEIVI